MQLAFELSGEHETLPKAEVFACLDALNIAYEERTISDRLVVIDTQFAPGSELLEVLSRRLGMTHHIYLVLGMSVLDEAEIITLVKDTDLRRVMKKDPTFAVRTRFARKNRLHSKRLELLTSVGECIKRKGYAVNLETPSRTFVLLLTEQRCLFCMLVHSVDKQQFEEKKPHRRPFFSPVVIMPKIARVLVNLSGVNATTKELFLDPFCGTGGILLEAGTVGARIIGADVQEKMVRGAQENLKFFGLRGDFIVSDASEIPLRANSVNAIATDMPYGRASFVPGSSSPKSRSAFIERLHQDATAEIYRVLKHGRKAVIVSNSPLFHSRSHEHGFRLIEQHTYRVHKSLTRYITVFEKA
jgi:tRNA (guanine10-N2)-dimethyltransferase